MTEQFKLKQSAYRGFLWKSVLRVIGIVLLFLAFILVMKRDRITGQTLWLYILSALVAIGAALFINLKKQKEHYDSFLIEVNEKRVCLEVKGISPVMISMNQISHVRRLKNGGLRIQGPGKQYIYVPPFLEDLPGLLQTMEKLLRNSEIILHDATTF